MSPGGESPKLFLPGIALWGLMALILFPPLLSCHLFLFESYVFYFIRIIFVKKSYFCFIILNMLNK